MRAFALAFAFVFALGGFAGCITPQSVSTASTSATMGLPFPAASAFKVVGDDGKPLPWSLTVEKGPYHALPAQVVKVPSFDGTKLSVGVFLPDVPAGTKVPVLMD